MFFFLDEVRHGSDGDLIKRKSHGASVVDGLFLFFIGQMGTQELKSQDNILDAGVILHLLGESLVVPEQGGGFGSGHKVLIVRIGIVGAFDFEQEVELSTKYELNYLTRSKPHFST